MLKVNEYGGRQAKVNEKRQCFKGWETLVIYLWVFDGAYAIYNYSFHKLF